MRTLFLSLTIILGCLFLTQTVSGQDSSLRERLAKKQAQDKKQSIPQLTVRAENMNIGQTQEISNAPWMREIYRILDLDKEKNAPLYYPVTPIGDRMNLFTLIFKLLSTEEITAYEYLIDGREIFTPEYALKFKDLLDRFSIMHVEDNGKYTVEESDIPSNEVLRYYVKEAWYFDKTNSVVDIKILAICPVIIRQDDFGVDSTPNPLFWLPYEEIRPYAMRMPIMTSNLNNASNQTIDDFFRKHTFDGEIYKSTNMKNLSLAEAYPVDSIMKKEQKKIETQLDDFNKRLWVVNDSTKLEYEKMAKAGKSKKAYKADVRTNDTKEEKKEKEKEEKISSQKASGSSSSKQPVRSMRNRRR